MNESSIERDNGMTEYIRWCCHTFGEIEITAGACNNNRDNQLVMEGR